MTASPVAASGRVVVLGRGGAGKSTFAQRLAARTGLPLIVLDDHFWSSDLTPLPPSEWIDRQRRLACAERWIMDGDLGPYDVLAPRLERADLVVILDYSLLRCGWRALRRSRERLDFWWWLITWRRQHRPLIMTAVVRHARRARVVWLRRPAAAQTFLGQAFLLSGPEQSS